MRIHLLIWPILLLFTCVPNLGASQSPSKSEFWFVAPDNRPGAFLRGKAWNAKDVFSRAAVRQNKPNQPVQLLNAQLVKPTDPFALAFFAAQEDGKDPEIQLREAVEPHKPAPHERGAEGPTVFAGAVVGITLFVAGVAGWIALAISAFMLDRAKAASRPS